MPGRVKHHQSPARLHAHTSFKKRLARMASTGTSIFNMKNSSSSGPTLSKSAIIWISIISVIVVATAIVVTILLCRCTCSRKKRDARKRHANGHSHHSSLEVTDGRNDHWAWNKSRTPFGPTMRNGMDASGFMMTPLSKAAVRPAGSQLPVYPSEPVVVDEEVDPLTPVYARNKGIRYYPGFTSAWKRVSQIGRAY